MKAHVLLNVLNHADPQSEWDGADTLTAPDGTQYSIALSAETMTPGESRLVPAFVGVKPADSQVSTMSVSTDIGGAGGIATSTEVQVSTTSVSTDIGGAGGIATSTEVLPISG